MISRREIIKCLGVLPGALAASAGSEKKIDEKKHYAKFWAGDGDIIKCQLCPHECRLRNGMTGICRCRKNADGTLITLGYGNPCAIHIDPIEKKPLFHVLPGSKTYSIGVAGCNLRCKNCQNYSMSQKSPLETANAYLPPEDAVVNALDNGCMSISYTYSEPVVWIEYVMDTARLARKAGLKNILVTSGYINAQPFRELCNVIDCAHIDLKSFDDKIYRNLNAGSLDPVLETLKIAGEMGVWIEIVNLVVPSWSDNLQMIEKMCQWISETLGAFTPVHFSRFFPMFKLTHLSPTPTDVLEKARQIAKNEKLQFVYIGNVPEINSNTFCPSCNTLLIERQGYKVLNHLPGNGVCPSCKSKLAGVWEK